MNDDEPNDLELHAAWFRLCGKDDKATQLEKRAARIRNSARFEMLVAVIILFVAIWITK